MGQSTPEQFARKLGQFSTAVQQQNRKAIEARAKTTQRSVTLAAAASSGLGRKYAASGRWVRSRIVNDDTAEVRLRGGFAFLAERGSYKKPGGYPEQARRVTARRRRNAARRGQTINESGLLSVPPYGVFASVRHPAQRAHPFWNAGIEASRKPGYESYRKSVRESLTKVFR